METNPYTYYHPLTVRYGDLDPQAHVNNAVYLTYLESARLGYYQQAGIWQPELWATTGMVVARVEIDYLAPITFGQTIRVGLRLTRLGKKSMTLDFQIESLPDQQPLARGLSVMVAYDNQANRSCLIPQDWRKKLTQFEGWETDATTA